MSKLPKPFTRSDIEFLGMVTRKLREAEGKGKKVMHLTTKNCRRLEMLAGMSEEYCSVWDKIRPEYKAKYPCELHNIRTRLRMVKARIRALQR